MLKYKEEEAAYLAKKGREIKAEEDRLRELVRLDDIKKQELMDLVKKEDRERYEYGKKLVEEDDRQKAEYIAEGQRKVREEDRLWAERRAKEITE
jgi:hypothetical protein